MTLHVAHPARLQNLRAGEKWIYADDDFCVYQSIEKKYHGASERLISAHVFQEKAVSLRLAFVKWVDDCMRGRCPKRWLTTPFQKDTFASNLFLHLVWIDVIREVLEKSPYQIVVVTADLGLATSLQNLARSMQVEFYIVGREYFWADSLRRTARAFAKLFYETANVLWRLMLSNFVLGKRYLGRMAGIELLIDTFLHEGDIEVDGEYHGRYLPGLLQFYLLHGYQAAIYSYLYNISPIRLIALYRQIRESRYLFLLPESFLKIKDVVAALAVSVRAVFFKENPLFCGLNVSPLVTGLQTKFALGGFIPLLLEMVPERMYEAGVRPKWVVDWFENQPVDKALCMGFGKYQPQCQVVGVAQYASCGNDFFTFRSDGELSAGVVPNEIWFCGSELKKIAGFYGTADKYRIVPALRYSYLYQSPHVIEKADTILVLLPHSAEESMCILNCVAPLCQKEEAGGTRFIVKTHPDMNLALFRKKVEQQFPAFRNNAIEWTDQKLSMLLPTAKAVVTSGSSAAVEAVCQGIPVVLIGRQAGLNFNPLEKVDARIWTMAYSPNHLKEAIAQRFCEEQLSGAERLTIAENTRKVFFMIAESNEMRRFLPTVQQ